jgi:hypothetical protein
MSGGVKNYSTSTLVSPNNLRNFMGSSLQWDEAAINKRQQELAQKAPQVWQL